MLEKETAAAIGQMLEMWSKRGLQWVPRCEPIVPPSSTGDSRSATGRSPSSDLTASATGVVMDRPTSPKSVQTHSAIAVGASSSSESSSEGVRPVVLEKGVQRWATAALSKDERAAQFAKLRGEVAACTKCADLACSRKQTVFGVGNLMPRVAFFGEAPGAEEDKTGEPFVGPAGQLLTKIIEATTMRREDVYILNSLRCRPPMNRTPTDIEVENCRPFFEAQLETLQPEYIVCLGAVAVRAVLRRTEPIGRLRGKFYAYGGAKVLVTYHPSYLLRNPDVKKLVWQDMQLLMRELGIPLPGGAK